MEDVLGKVLAAVVVIAAVIFDWPRALAGLLVGFFVRRSGIAYAPIAIVAGVVAVAGLGELIYPIIGRTAEATWSSFTIGLISAGACAYGLFRYMYDS